MATLNIDGVGRVTVDDSFLKLSPEDQAKTVDEIVASRSAKATPKAEAAPAQPQPNKSAFGYVDDFVRGAADTLTFGYADEISAGLDRLFGINTGKQGGPAPQNYDEALKAQRARDEDGGGARVAGQVVGGFIPIAKGAQLADKALKAARVVPTATKVAAVTGGVGGGLYGTGSADGDLTDRAIGGAMGLGTGAVLGAGGAKVVEKVTDRIPTLRAGKMMDKPYAAMDAEIVDDLNKIKVRPTAEGDNIIVKQRNQLGTQYIDELKTNLQDAGVKLTKEMKLAIKTKDIAGPDLLDQVAKQEGGKAVADTITKYQRLMEMTKPEAAAGGIPKLVRGAVDWALPKNVANAVNSTIGARTTAEQKIQNLLTNPSVKASQIVSERLGPSAATESAQALASAAKQNANRIAQLTENKAAQSKVMAERLNQQNIALAKARAPYAEGSKLGPNASPQAVLVEAFEDATGIKHKPGMVQDVLKAIKKGPKEGEAIDFGGAFNKEVDQAIKALGNKPGRIDNLTNLVRAVRAKAAVQQALGTLKVRQGQTVEQGAGRIRNAERYNAKVIENTLRDIAEQQKGPKLDVDVTEWYK